MDKPTRDVVFRSLNPAAAALELCDELSFRLQAIEDILISEGLTSERKLRQTVEAIRRAVEKERDSVGSALLKEIHGEKNRRLLKKLFDKPAGPPQ
jgi:predicted trehalose synthase